MTSPAWPSSTGVAADSVLTSAHSHDFQDGFIVELYCPFPQATGVVHLQRAVKVVLFDVFVA